MSDTREQTQTAKAAAAKAAAAMVETGMAVGLGSGSTAALVVQALGERVADEGLKIVGVPTSVATAELANSLSIPLRHLDDLEALDLNLDGADEVDPEFRMIKGRGGALLREKLVASVARRRVTVVTSEKRVARLGDAAPIPVEVSSIGTRHIERRLQSLGARTALRLRPDGSLYQTDNGNRIIDCWFASPVDPDRAEAALKQIVGVFETGLFVNLCDVLIVGYPDRVERLERHARATGTPG
jgi:ribose 5-phosphate isomerase A